MATVIEQIPPLAPGDNLSREEFLRRWEHHPEIKKAELAHWKDRLHVFARIRRTRRHGK